MAVAFIPKSDFTQVVDVTKPSIVPCVWDALVGRYVPLSSPRGQIIYKTPVAAPRAPVARPEPVVKVPATVVDHPCGLSVPSDIRKDGLCGVLAVAVASGRTLNEVFTHMARRHRGNWKGSTTAPERMNALKHFGVNFEPVLLVPNMWNLERWARKFARPDVTYIVTTTKHVQVVRNGFVIDQQGLKIVRDYWGKGKKVNSVWEIVK